MSVLFYRRPDYVSKAPGPMTSDTCQRYIDRAGNVNAIPSGLSFDNVLSGKTMPPCSLGDFMDYLTYIQHNAENLQFYLWLQDYKKRFARKKLQDQALSPEWKPEPLLSSGASARGSTGSVAKPIGSILYDTQKASLEETNPNSPAPRVPPANASTPVTPGITNDAAPLASSARPQELNPATQPFREEIDKIVAHYIAPGSPRELNISSRDRTALMFALQHTTHPSVFTLVGNVIDTTLRCHSHPNFVRWSICNGNKPYVFFVRSVAIASCALGIATLVLLTLSKASRWWRITAAPHLLFGIATIVAGYKGLCLILHTTAVRNVRPWEQFGNDIPTFMEGDDEATIAEKRRESRASLNTFGTRNSFEGEPWMENYKKKPLLRRVFDKRAWVQDESVRKLQDKIAFQSQLWALIIGVPLIALFVALPSGNFY